MEIDELNWLQKNYTEEEIGIIMSSNLAKSYVKTIVDRKRRLDELLNDLKVETLKSDLIEKTASME